MDSQLTNYYTQNGLDRAIDIFTHPEEYKIKHRILAYRYLFQFRHLYFKSPSKISIENQIINLYTHLLNNIIDNDYILLELMDIMLEYTDKGNVLLNNRRLYEDKKNNVQRAANIPSKIDKTIYNDSQNVHNSTINNSVKSCAIRLCNIMKTDYIISKPEWSGIMIEFKHIYDINKYSTQLEKIETDTGNFNIGLNIQTIFCSLWKYIKHHKYNKELYNRLANELDAMKGVCLTGYLSRLMNVIQGFTDDEKLQIKISDDEQINSIIKYNIDKIIKEDDDMFDLLLSDDIDNKIILYMNILEKILDKVKEWSKEYKVEDNIIYPILDNMIKKYIGLNNC